MFRLRFRKESEQCRDMGAFQLRECQSLHELQTLLDQFQFLVELAPCPLAIHHTLESLVLG